MPRPASLTTQGMLRIVLAGLGAGLLSGLFGVGGGILIVPALVFVLHQPQRLAHGTSLAAIVPIAIGGVVAYGWEGKVDWSAALLLAIGAAVIGAVIGTHLLHVVPTRVLADVFAALLVLSALRLLLDHSEAPGRGPITVGLALALVAVGVAAGVLAGMLGVGGGVVLIPAMVVLFGLPSAVAKGTSLAVILPTALVGTARNLRMGNADLRVGAIVGVAGMAAALVGSLLSVGLDEGWSNVLFALFMLLTAARMVYSEHRRRPGDVVLDPPGEA